ncbi:hypothetical protein MYCTH_2295558 [Thermothelomyces thermophilus ATCC 42464]|uniref:Fungal STAND N-terminal Goodbye domain-containing protein n=1 Tax=Thermothelomyces thermophilus (strain ATCC 42464 / BCRC 31852 / DSM 1799) TaxID=573729 RepID=G2Q5E1_THET4|nr:uncharacterized protein MYCTH_2295558 [Thermothelomyces thermophilus ATCC 42464]AEO53772.1 hypothetical protein MYCTH_2295558 [Thermothelomyces thermophilus ATCC 42464]
METQQELGELNWLRPGKQEVVVVGNFVADEAPRLHAGFGGSSELDAERARFIDPEPYSRLEHALKDYIAETLRIEFTTFDNSLADKIGAMEKAFGKSKQGLWHRLWYGLGNNKDVIEAWVDLIPDQYGLSVIKAGLAVVFKLAENSNEKRQRVFKTFSTLRDSLVELHPDRGRFLSDPDVRKAATELYTTIIRSIEDMVLVLTMMEKSRWNMVAAKFAARLKREHGLEESRPTPATILQTLEDHIAKYEKAIGLARDRVHERAEAYSRFNATQTVFVHEVALATKNGLERHASRVEDIGARLIGDVSHLREMANADITHREEQSRRYESGHSEVLNALRGSERELQRVAQEQRDTRALIRTLLLGFIMESKQQEARYSEIATLQRQQASHTRTKHAAVVSLERLCDILARPLSTALNPDDPPSLDLMFQHASADLGHALAEQGRFPLKAQGQAQSLLATDQFFNWMSRSHPTLLLVDANIRDSELESLSAISVLSSTLVTSLMEAYPDDVVIHFFCGMHDWPRDAWYGPNGLVRSLILQLLMKLATKDPDMSSWNLDFINDRGFLESLEQHCLDDLCLALHWLLYEFPPDTCIYCIIDSVSRFDVDRLLKDLGTVMECLRTIVNDASLVPIFKVLLTNPGESTWAIKNMPLFKEDPSRMVCLSRVNLVPAHISGRAVSEHLLMAPSATGRRSPSPFRHSRTPSPFGHSRAPSPFRHSRSPSPAILVSKRISEPVLPVREVFGGDGVGGYDF